LRVSNVYYKKPQFLGSSDKSCWLNVGDSFGSPLLLVLLAVAVAFFLALLQEESLKFNFLFFERAKLTERCMY
jgi:hypothetical protein